MNAEPQWKALGWRHTAWDLLRYYCSLRGSRKPKAWLDQLRSTNVMSIDSGDHLSISKTEVDLFLRYLEHRPAEFARAFELLRTEDEALAYSSAHGIVVGRTKTQNQEHHQSSKALVATVSSIARRVARINGISVETNPQTRCVWCTKSHMHVTARNLDGAVPGLANPYIVWEIKEYWGNTGGGSKMSDAVYECTLVGRELREFESDTGVRVVHIVFVDGKEQWSARTSDLGRFLDLMNQGLIDYLFIGREIESAWEPSLLRLTAPAASTGF